MHLSEWIAQHTAFSAQQLVKAISADTLCRERPEFGQKIMPARGSVLASRVIANWDPEPDYFFHWTRDAAVALRAVVDMVALATTPAQRRQWQQRFHDMVQFSLAIARADTLKPAPVDYRERTQRSCRQFLRTRKDLASVQGDKLLAEPRFNPDGSVDFLKWSRPQLDGPALRALACLAWLAEGGKQTMALLELLQGDLEFTLRNSGSRSIGPWEEPNEFAHHHHVALVQLGALAHGREFAGTHLALWQKAEKKLRAGLDRHWSESQQLFTAIRGGQLADMASVLAIMEADLPGSQHSVLDPRAVATLAALERSFADAFPVNQRRPRGLPPALGRSLADKYFGGGAWYATTLGAAAFCYRHAVLEPATALQWRQRGDNYLATVRWMTPADGSMSEQVDRTTLQPRSAQHLTWSYAAFISAVRQRQRLAVD